MAVVERWIDADALPEVEILDRQTYLDDGPGDLVPQADGQFDIGKWIASAWVGAKIGPPRYSWIPVPHIPQKAILRRSSSGAHGLAMGPWGTLKSEVRIDVFTKG
jgi:hypothetical protein